MDYLRFPLLQCHLDEKIWQKHHWENMSWVFMKQAQALTHLSIEGEFRWLSMGSKTAVLSWPYSRVHRIRGSACWSVQEGRINFAHPWRACEESNEASEERDLTKLVSQTSQSREHLLSKNRMPSLEWAVICPVESSPVSVLSLRTPLHRPAPAAFSLLNSTRAKYPAL